MVDPQQQQQQGSFSFFQQQTAPSHSDPFANIGHQQHQPPLQPPPPSVASPQSHYRQQPPQQQTPRQPPPPTHEQARYASTPTRPPMSYPQQHVPLQTTPAAPPPTTGFAPRPQFDPSKPPPTSADLQTMQAASPSTGVEGPQMLYQPVQAHWFYCREIEQRFVWTPFTMLDSLKLEETRTTVQQDPEECIVQTDGGRYDVNITRRIRNAIYWEEKPSEVRRCTWFYKGDGDNKFVPYNEVFAEKLEEEYQIAVTNNAWHRRLEFPDAETVVMHNPNVIVHFRPSSQADEWGTTPDSHVRPRVVKRGVDEDVGEIEEGEPAQIDHVLFVVHGIGPVCDLRFRSIVECVDDFRSVSLGLLQSHFKNHQDENRIGRLEFIPVSWHDVLHGDATGVDRRLRKITLPSIGRLRHFTNDTLLDILFYSSPTYCQTVSDRVGGEINRLYQLFMERNPRFNGQVSIVGHSLGSLICFDLLSHQKKSGEEKTAPASQQPESSQASVMAEVDGSLDASNTMPSDTETEPLPSIEDALSKLGLSGFTEAFQREQIDMEALTMCSESDIKEIGLPLGPRKKLMGFVKEQAEKQEQRKKDAAVRAKMEAEIAAQKRIQEEVQRRQQQQQQQDSHEYLHSTTSVHIDYTPGLTVRGTSAVLGIGQPLVKYPQLVFKPSCFFAVGSPIGMFLTVRGVETIGEDSKLPTCDGFFNIFHPFDPVAYRIEPLINATFSSIKPVLMPHHKGRKRLHLELKDSLSAFGADLKRSLVDSMKKTWKTIHEFALSHKSSSAAETEEEPTEEEMEKIVSERLSQEESKAAAQTDTASISSTDSFEFLGDDVRVGKLNKGNRVDYVLQEKPIESFNDYIFALGSHACYWESEDTMLMILKEVYALQGILPQKQGPDRMHQAWRPPPQQQTLLPSP
ncbi:triacylglycerol hydrolase DDHD2-like isoform X2 [Glandiceps talaboti]